jgi:hypothetical protein
VVADVVRRDLLHLAERVPLRCPDAHRDPIACVQLARRDDRRDAALPEHEDRVPVVTERLVERLAEHCPKRPQVPIGDVQRQVSARCRCVERAAEEPERLGGEAPGGARVGDAARGGRLDLRE